MGPKQTWQIASNYCQVKTDLCAAGKFEGKTRFASPLASRCYLVLPGRKKEACSCREKSATCGWERDWKWQRAFLSVFEKQLLTFPAKSSNMLSVTSGLWAWQSLGLSVIMEIFVDVCAWRKPRGAFTRHTIKPSPPSNSRLCIEFFLALRLFPQPVISPSKHSEWNRSISAGTFRPLRKRYPRHETGSAILLIRR